MAAELHFDAGPSQTGLTLYAWLRNMAGQSYNTVTPGFEAYNASNVTNYDVALVEQGASGYYIGTMPTVAAGIYFVTVKQQAGGSPAVSDIRIGGGAINWDGTAVVYLSTAAVAAAVRDVSNASPAVGGLGAGVKAVSDRAPSSGTLAIVGDAMSLTTGERAAVAAALLDLANGVESGVTVRQSLRGIAATLLGQSTGSSTSTEAYKAAANAGTTRVTVTADTNGNRTGMTLNL